MADILDSFIEYTEGMPVPPIFRLWGGIAMLAGALERRTWLLSAGERIYPNLYTLMVAPPGVGKYIIHEVRRIWQDAKKFKIAPDSITKASLIDAIGAALTVIPTKEEFIEYHSLLIASEEFGVLFPDYDKSFLAVLNSAYNCSNSLSEQRRSVNGGDAIVITNPQLNILAGTQPGYIGGLFPEEFWSTGTASRLIMVYSAQPILVDLFPSEETLAQRRRARKAIVETIAGLFEARGQFDIAPEVQVELKSWYLSGMEPLPTHTKLISYNNRRILHLAKLLQVSAISRGELRITMDDYTRAQGWMLTVESFMPDIFRSMTQKSDREVMLELHRFMWRIYAKDQKALHESLLADFLSKLLPSEKIFSVIRLAELSNIIQRNAGTRPGEGALYIPTTMNLAGIE